MLDPQQLSEAAEALEAWLVEQLGASAIARMGITCAAAAVRNGLFAEAQIRKLVEEANQQGRLTPPCFFFAALLDLTNQGKGIQMCHVTIPVSCQPLPTCGPVAPPISDFTMAELLQRFNTRIQPSIN